jgi:aryl-alcohol dehydrogenase-like predicted oxidoreductase
MGMSGMYGPADEQESLATIGHAIDRGISLIDTGDFYGMGHNEMLIARAIRGRRDQVQLSVKFGAQRAPDGSWIGFDGRPAAVKTALAYSLRRLQVDHIDIYRPARLDTNVPIEDTIGAVADMVRAGYVRQIGLSEVGVPTIRRAVAVHPIVDLQIEYSLFSRGPEQAILPALAELGIGVTAYGVLSRGLLSGSSTGDRQDLRSHLPRFTGANRQRNDALVGRLSDAARARGCTTTQLAIAWVLARGASIVPTLGCRTRAQLDEAFGALDVRLSAGEVESIAALVPANEVAGTRYADAQMRHLDSER